MAIVAFLTALSILAPVPACSGPTRATFDVVAAHGPVDTSTDLTLAQISELADRTGRIGKHPPFGFYIGGFGSTISAEISARNEADCSEPVRVTVTLMLANRHIEIGKELAAKPCRFSVVLDHYRRHAASDDVVLAEFAQALATALKGISLPPLAHDPALAEEDRRRVEQVVASMVERRLKPLDTARANARDSVDTVQEAEKLKGAPCSDRVYTPLTSPPSSPSGSATSSPDRMS